MLPYIFKRLTRPLRNRKATANTQYKVYYIGTKTKKQNSNLSQPKRIIMDNHSDDSKIIEPLVTVQILNWNRADETLRAIDSVLSQSYPNIEIVIIDNGSTDGSVEKIKQYHPLLKLIELDENYGCPGGRNRGIEFCSGDYIFFCDNDGVLHKDAVLNAMKVIRENDEIVILTGLVKDFIFEDEIDTKYVLSAPSYNETNLFQGGITMHRKFIYDNISMYPDDYMYGGEETFLALKVLDAGYSIVRCNQVVLWHKKSEHARDIRKESLQAWGNKLVNSFQLYPFLPFLSFFLYFWVVYPYYAFREGFFRSFIASVPGYYKRLRNYKRTPVKNETYRKFVKLSR